MFLKQAGAGAVSQLLLQRRRADDVRKNERHDARSVALAEFGQPLRFTDRNLLFHDGVEDRLPWTMEQGKAFADTVPLRESFRSPRSESCFRIRFPCSSRREAQIFLENARDRFRK